MLGDTATRVLLAVIQQQRPTVETVAAELGISKSTAHFHLNNLHDAGLVAYGHGQRGALRPLVALARTPVRRYDDVNETAPSSAGNADTGPRPTHLVGGGRLEADSIPPTLVLHEGGLD